MSAIDVMVIGGGPAGVAASIAMAQAGRRVVLCEQGVALGGTIHRQHGGAARPVPVPAVQAERWRKLHAALATTNVRVLLRHSFLGIDGNGVVLIEDRSSGRVLQVRASALLLAVGGLERVAPRPGWQLPGVTTAGGLQVMLKATGQAPRGTVLLAGSGPLLLAVAAQLAALGRPPVAVLERSRRASSPLLGLPLLRRPAYLLEALQHLLRLWRSGVRWRLGTELQTVEKTDDGRLAATIVDAAGRSSQMTVDRIALHDGLRSNSIGLPQAGPGTATHPYVAHAGDCREALGGVAAIADGRRAGLELVAHLTGSEPDIGDVARTIRAERVAQTALAKLFDTGPLDLSALPDKTVLCQCEGRTMGDLRALLASPDRPSPREVKLNGRFGMGACQGRYCLGWVADIMAAHNGGVAATPEAFVGNRWPLRPVSVASFLDTGDAPATDSED